MSLQPEISAEHRGDLLSIVDGLSINPTTEGFSHSVRGVMSGVLDGEDIAIKPFIDREGASHETVMQQFFEQAGIDTYSTLGIVMGGTANYLLTRIKRDVTPIDQLNLRSMDTSGLTTLCMDIGILAGRMHSNGLVHGDFQPKNVFRDSKGRLGVGDLDRAQIYGDTNSAELAEECARDIELMREELSKQIDRDRKRPSIKQIVDTYSVVTRG